MSNELKSFSELKTTITAGKDVKPKDIATLEFSVIEGKIFHNGLNLVHNCAINKHGARFIYRDTAKAGKHFAVELNRVYVGRVFCSDSGNYITRVVQDYLGNVSVKSKCDKPIELETDPIRIALRKRKIFPSKRMIVEVKEGTPLTYTTNQPSQKRQKAPVGSRSAAFTSDGIECVEERTHPGIKDSPITGKVTGATFLIQYSTIYRRNKPRRWIEKVIVTPAVQMVNLEKALDRVIDIKDRPEKLLQLKHTIEPAPEEVPVATGPEAWAESHEAADEALVTAALSSIGVTNEVE